MVRKRFCDICNIEIFREKNTRMWELYKWDLTDEGELDSGGSIKGYEVCKNCEKKIKKFILNLKELSKSETKSKELKGDK